MTIEHLLFFFFFFQAEDGIRDIGVTGVQTCALPILRKSLDKLLNKFNIIHICGKGNIKSSLKNKKGYAQFEYVKEELPHFMNGCDIVISRAGANVIFELLALKKPNLLIPLRSEEHTSELQSRQYLVCRLLLEKKKQ